MAQHIYRYQMSTVDIDELARALPLLTPPSLITSAPAVILDIQIDDSSLVDLDEAMAKRGFSRCDITDPTTAPVSYLKDCCCLEDVVVLGSNIITNSVALVDATGLSFPVKANSKYFYDFELLYQTANATRGISLAINGPVDASLIHVNAYITRSSIGVDSVYKTDSIAYDTFTNTASTNFADRDYLAYLKGFLHTVSAGTLIVRVASEAVDTNVSIRAGSIGLLRKVG